MLITIVIKCYSSLLTCQRSTVGMTVIEVQCKGRAALGGRMASVVVGIRERRKGVRYI